MKSLCLLSCLALLEGRATPLPASNHATRAFYPLGIYAVNSTNDYAMVRAAGFNLITSPAVKSCLDAANAAGLKVLASPGTSAGPGFNPDAAKKTVKAFDAHPALWAWYLADEPDLQQIPPKTVVKNHTTLKRLKPTKPTALVLFQGYEALDYANITDILMIDKYPVPWLPLASFGQHVEMTRLALGKSKPLIAVIQAFDWGSIPEMLPGEKNLRPPTYEEIRCMTYEALARGANGLFYFAFDAGWKMREHPETWAALSKVVREVNERLPLFQAERQWWAKEHRFGDPTHRFNAALQSSVTSCLLRVTGSNDVITPGDYILAVNNTDQLQDYSFAHPNSQPLVAPKLGESGSTLNYRPTNVLGEGRAIQPDATRLRDQFAPYAVHIYGPF
ncbi:MAG: hypothetical protein NT154_15500 [Verrucomicrobia bacterium]|nr:hypothetical protein [Verrucomicrobiota bacterium]